MPELSQGVKCEMVKICACFQGIADRLAGIALEDARRLCSSTWSLDTG